MGVFIRIILRVFAGILIGWGLPADWAHEIANDPEVLATAETMAGAAIWGLTEIYYGLARRYGWKT